VWHPLNFVTFDGNSTESKYLDITGVWKDLPQVIEIIPIEEKHSNTIFPVTISMDDIIKSSTTALLQNNEGVNIGMLQKRIDLINIGSLKYRTFVYCFIYGKTFVCTYINKNNKIVIESDWVQINNNMLISYTDDEWRLLTEDERAYLLQRDGGTRAGWIVIGSTRYLGLFSDNSYLTFNSGEHEMVIEPEYVIDYIKDGSLVLLPSTGYLFENNVYDLDKFYYKVGGSKNTYIGEDPINSGQCTIVHNEDDNFKKSYIAARYVQYNNQGRFSVSDSLKVNFAEGNLQVNYF
jgi:hypothetical protein